MQPEVGKLSVAVTRAEFWCEMGRAPARHSCLDLLRVKAGFQSQRLEGQASLVHQLYVICLTCKKGCRVESYKGSPQSLRLEDRLATGSRILALSLFQTGVPSNIERPNMVLKQQVL